MLILIKFYWIVTLLWRTFVGDVTFLWTTFWVITKCEEKFWRQLLTIIYNKNTARCAYKNNQKSRLNFYDNLWQLKSSIMDNSWIYFVWVGRMRWAHWQSTTKWFVLNGEWNEWNESIKHTRAVISHDSYVWLKFKCIFVSIVSIELLL